MWNEYSDITVKKLKTLKLQKPKNLPSTLNKEYTCKSTNSANDTLIQSMLLSPRLQYLKHIYNKNDNTGRDSFRICNCCNKELGKKSTIIPRFAIRYMMNFSPMFRGIALSRPS